MTETTRKRPRVGLMSDSTKLPDDLRTGNDRVLMFEDGRWQPLRPRTTANQGQRRVGLTEFHL